MRGMATLGRFVNPSIQRIVALTGAINAVRNNAASIASECWIILLAVGLDGPNVKGSGSDVRSARIPAKPFGYSGHGQFGNRADFARRLNIGAPAGSVSQKEHRQVDEEEIPRLMLERLDYEGRQDDGQEAILNLDSVSEKVSQKTTSFVGAAALNIVSRTALRKCKKC